MFIRLKPFYFFSFILLILISFTISFGQVSNTSEFIYRGEKILDENGVWNGLMNMNPDPDGEPWIAGGLNPLTEQEKVEFSNLPKFKTPEHLKGRMLPPTCDNSTAPQFRKIFNQIGGSCGQASGMGYHFTYERNLVLGTLPTTKNNVCAYGFAWNFVNGGSGSGSWPSAGYNIAKEMGCGHVADFNNADNGGSGTAWMDGYKGYFNANDCHVVEQVSFTPADIDELKNWFYDKGTGTGKNGGLVTFGSSVSFSISTISSGPYAGQKLCTSLPDGSAHAMTLAGYSDEISYDINGDGKITNNIDLTRDGLIDYRDREEGAWQLVNSWGSGWNNSGKVWVLYSGLDVRQIRGITVEKFETKLMIKTSVTHSSRGSLKLTTGFSSDITASTPSETKSYSKAFNKAGGSHPMEGNGGNSTIEIGLDATEFYTTGMAQGKFFLIAESSSGTVKSMSLVDYTSGDVLETVCDQTNVSISGKTYLSVIKTFAPLTTLSPNGGEKWERDRTFDVSWSTSLSGNFKIELLKGGTVNATLASSVPAGNNVYKWAIPTGQELGADYKIRVTSLSDPTKVDESDAEFAIEEKSTLDLTSPNGGEEIEKGTTVDITWNDNLSGNVTIGLYKDNKLYSTIAENISSQSPYKWQISDKTNSGLDYRIRVTSVNKEWLFDESQNNFTIRNPVIRDFPYVQDFDKFDIGSVALREYWEQLTVEDLDWTVCSGPTPSRVDDPPDETGPMSDHTSGNGKYLFTEASGSNNPGKKMDMLTPIFDFSRVSNAGLTFWYHMFDKTEQEMGHLYMDINTDGTWENDVIHLSGNSGDKWLEKSLDLSKYAGTKLLQIRFRGVTGQGWHSDICIDDFKIDAVIGINSTRNLQSTFQLKFYNPRLIYDLPNINNSKKMHVTINLYNLQGKLIKTLVNEAKAPGKRYTFIFNNKNFLLARGIYLVKMNAGDNKTTTRIIIK